MSRVRKSSPHPRMMDVLSLTDQTGCGPLRDNDDVADSKKDKVTKRHETKPVENKSHAIITKLRVSVTITASFRNVDALKATIRDALNFPAGGKFEITFTSHILLPVISTCNFEIVTNKNLFTVEHCIEDMIKLLRNKLKTIVEFDSYPDRSGKIEQPSQVQTKGILKIPSKIKASEKGIQKNPTIDNNGLKPLKQIKSHCETQGNIPSLDDMIKAQVERLQKTKATESTFSVKNNDLKQPEHIKRECEKQGNLSTSDDKIKAQVEKMKRTANTQLKPFVVKNNEPKQPGQIKGQCETQGNIPSLDDMIAAQAEKLQKTKATESTFAVKNSDPKQPEQIKRECEKQGNSSTSDDKIKTQVEKIQRTAKTQSKLFAVKNKEPKQPGQIKGQCENQGKLSTSGNKKAAQVENLQKTKDSESTFVVKNNEPKQPEQIKRECEKQGNSSTSDDKIKTQVEKIQRTAKTQSKLFAVKNNGPKQPEQTGITSTSQHSIDELLNLMGRLNNKPECCGREKATWSSRIEKILSKMENKKDNLLAKHDEKISSIKSKRSVVENNNRRYKAENNAIEDKLMEAYSQRIEFFCKCNQISMKIKEMKPSLTSERELYRIQEDFGVECQRLANALPIYARREDIVSHVKSNQVSVILGETGSGKSTQIAQYLHEAGNSRDGFIVCTQPRKVAAVQLADRVAQEMTVRTGDLVGYKTGNKRKMNDNTKIVFMTDHSLLNECLEDRDFQKYSCIIVDEAHERSIYTDILLGMIKACLKRRPDLRVVITSATIDPQVFINYFQCPKEINVSGRTFPVEVFYTESSDDFENYERKAVCKAAEIHRHQPEGDILVFLTSAVEIQRCCEEFCKIFKDKNDFKCLPLHGQLLPEEQRKVFSKLDEGVRKVVFATNCAETSITIDGIKYVIDTGVSKEMRYDAKKNLNLLGVHMISQSSANQRKGRAGRTASGKCFRLFSEKGFEGMRKTNQPEILRVHLGQAILKLAELGVNIRDYDFVESPSVESLQAALETLEFLGALKDEKITDMGRWISKLPFDPKLGYVVYKARENDLLYDGIVLASVVSNGSGLFYRGLTETEAQISARIKVEFGLKSGDIFTWFSIYKMWEAITTIQEKRRWCKFNCINYKSMTYTKTCVDEVIPTLRHDLQLDIAKQYSDEPSSMTVLSKLMLRAYGMSLCHFMGHSRAGYFSLVSQRQVHLHPSSTLAAQNVQPEWLVFVELVKTSREFIKGILVVDEEWIQEAVDEGRLDVNVAKAKEGTLTVVHKEELGMSVFKNIVGPRYSGIHFLEKMCEQFGMKHPIIEADRELGTISIYSTSPEIHQNILGELQKVKSDTISKLEEEESMCKIFDNESSDKPNIRAVIGTGACVRHVLMPHQTTEVLLRKVGQATQEDILLKFSEFGNIIQIISFKSVEPWGFVRYRSAKEAAIACERTRLDKQIAGSPKLDKGNMNTTSVLQAKFSWVRRPVKGEGMAFLKCDPMDKAELVGKSVMVNGGFRCIKPARKRNVNFGGQENDSSEDLVVFNIGKTTTEDELKGLINHGVLGGAGIDMKITILREKVPVPFDRELDAMRDRLRNFIDPDNVEDFNIRILSPRPNSVYQIGFLYFNDPVRGLRVCQRQNHRITMGLEPVTLTPTIRTTIIVPKNIKEACQKQIDDLFVNMERDLAVDFEWKELTEAYAITMRCEDPEGIIKARDCIAAELKGDPIDCSVIKSRQILLTPAGQHYLRQLQESTDCVIISDRRTKIVHLYGNPRVKDLIHQYLAENEGKRVMTYKLKYSGKPPGLMKALMNKFGPLLDGMTERYRLSSVALDCRSHTLKCSGSDAAVDEFDKFLSSLESELFASNLSGSCVRNKSLPECVVCLDDVDDKDTLYRLEACGHPYCVPCLQHQVLACVQSNQFPLACTQEDCEKEFVWKDLNYIFTKKWVTQEKLIHSSLNFLVSSQPEKYKFCPTPNCPVVYKVTQDEDGCEFNCAACFASTCSSCHVAFHAGVSCKMAKSGTGAEGHLREWAAEDPKKRKMCPGCNIPIEKTEGCNKMHCSSCHTIFCWICREKFKDEGRCYDHLTKSHNGIFEA